MRAQDQAAAEELSLPQAVNNHWPPQVKYIVGNEACERFSYYGMKCLLALYITVVLLKTSDDATTIIALFSATNYFMPILGAWVSDRYWGRYHTILWISLFYCLGAAVLATSDFIPTISGKTTALYVGLAMIAFGSGGIKPCVSAFMGDQFKPEQRHLLQKAYAVFYWSINLGSFFSLLIIPFVHKHWGYTWAFGIPGITMAIATFIFWTGTKYYHRVPPSRVTKSAGFIKVFLAACSAQRGAKLGAGFNILTSIGLPLLVLLILTVVDFTLVVTPAVRLFNWFAVGCIGIWYILIVMANLLGRSRLGPAFNILTSIGLPLVAMVILAVVAFTREMTPALRVFNWAALACIVLWYVLILLATLLGRSELPDSFWQGARDRFSEAEVTSARSVSPLLFVFGLLPIFWAVFDQNFSTWLLQGKSMMPYKIGPYSIGPEEMTSANPLLVMILLPIMTWGLYPLLGRLATPLRRMSVGMVLAAASFVVVAAIQERIEAGYQLSILWQLVPYVIITISEVLVSTTGLEFAFREAAPEMKSIVMGIFNLTITMGNLIIVGITKALATPGAGAHNASVSSGRFLMYAGLMAVVAVSFSIVSAFYRYRDEAAARGK